MKISKLFYPFLFALIAGLSVTQAQPSVDEAVDIQMPAGLNEITPGADQTYFYLDYLKGKNVGMVINQTSVIGADHTLSVDTLLDLGIKVKKIFGPEHGFRGNASDGTKINDTTDSFTGLPVVSLYGNKHYKPTPADLKGLDLVIFDIQDVGARFYTYLSTLHYVMEACA